MNLAYLMLGLPYGVPYTIDQAYNFVKESVIAFGFLDIVFEPENPFTALYSVRLFFLSPRSVGVAPGQCLFALILYQLS